MVSVGITVATGVDNQRFGQVHTVLYSAGIGVFVILFIIEKITGFISGIVGKLCCCCLYRNTEASLVSTDLFRDISSDAQRKEYMEAKDSLRRVKNSVAKEEYSEWTALRQYATDRFSLKIKTIKYALECALGVSKIKTGGMRDTKDAFF